MDTTPSDRVQLIGRSQLMHPGCCALCGSGNCEDGYVDTGIYYDYEGQVYFCMTCVEQIISVVGGFTADQTAMLNGELAAKVAELSSVTAELEKSRERLGHYDAALADIASVGRARIDSLSVSSNQAEQEQSAVIDESVKSADSEQSVPSESSKSQGRRVASRTQRGNSSTADSGITI